MVLNQEQIEAILPHRPPFLFLDRIEAVEYGQSAVGIIDDVAQYDYVLRGQTLRAGERACLFYPSANRDEDVFPDGDVFRIDRRPNDHVGFGRGEHVCLGAHLARLELRTAFAHLRERLEHAELAGPPERARSSFVGGIKRAPMRWRIAPART